MQLEKIKCSAIKLAKIIPDDVLEQLSVETNADRYSKVLSGERMFHLLLYAFVSSDRVSQRRLESMFNSEHFKFMFNSAQGVTVNHSSISVRLSEMNVEFFRKAYEYVYGEMSALYTEQEIRDKHLVRVDSTMVAEACNKLQGQYTSGASSVSQKAAEAAWNGSQDCVEEMRVAFLRRRDLLVRMMREIPGMEVNVPDGAFYLFPRVTSFLGREYGGRKIGTDSELALYLLDTAHVATVGGEAFAAPGYLRLSYAVSDDDLVEAARRIAKAL